MNRPLISIITPSFNRAAMIADAVESVLAQGYSNFEHIIVDGASTDRTLEVLKKYPHLRIVSEPDRGMYDAINKGLALARGDILAWLNTDDLYPPGTFFAVVDVFTAHPDAIAISGAAETFVDSFEGPRVVKLDRAIDGVDYWRRIVEAPVPNGWFFSKSLFERIGHFNPDYRLVADREFLIRAALDGFRPVPVAQTLYRYRLHEDSATFHAEDSRHPVYGPRRMDVNREDLRMIGSYLARPGLPRPVRGVMVHAHSEYAYRLVSTALYHRRLGFVCEGMRAGLRYDPLFLLTFVRFAMRRVFREKS